MSMSMSTSIRRALRLGTVLLLLSGCLADVESSAELAGQAAELSLLPELPLQIRPLEDPLGGPLASSALEELVDSEREYYGLFGHRAPAEVNWAAGDKVLVYSAGAQPTTGYEAVLLGATLHTEYQLDPRLLRPRPMRRFVRVSAQLRAPGVACEVEREESVPYALGIVRTLVTEDEFLTQVRRVDCGGRSCEELECPPETRCELEDVTCVRAPCPPVAVCVPEAELAYDSEP
jgi:hypothetical protein